MPHVHATNEAIATMRRDFFIDKKCDWLKILLYRFFNPRSYDNSVARIYNSILIIVKSLIDNDPEPLWRCVRLQKKPNKARKDKGDCILILSTTINYYVTFILSYSFCVFP